ncbi:MAG: hypothetical protein IKQ90_09925 [Ruminococcus sp.]|nr:hypothetical protein [Ruminococcus sp.]
MFRKTLAFMTAFAAAACMFVSCGDKKADTSGSKSGKTKNIPGKYQVCDIDGFSLKSSDEGNYLEFDRDGKFALTYYKKDDYVKYRGTYKASGDKIELSFRKFQTTDEVKKANSLLADTDDEEYLNDAVSRQNEIIDREPTEYIFSGENTVTIADDQHHARKELYSYIADELLYSAGRMGIGSEYNVYCFYSSDKSLNTADCSTFFESELNDVVNSKTFLDNYTEEKGLTEDFDLTQHEWLVVTDNDMVVAFGIGEDFDSDVCGISNMWYFENDSPEFVSDDSEKPETLRELYEYYTERNK